MMIRRSFAVKTTITFLFLLQSVSAIAGTTVLTCSCDVNDQIDVQGPIRSYANQNEIQWHSGELIIIQNGEYWRAYKFSTYYAKFVKQLAGGEGDYSSTEANSLFSVGINGDGGEQGSIVPLGNFLLQQAFGQMNFPPGAIVVLNGSSDNFCGPGTQYVCVSNSIGGT